MINPLYCCCEHWTVTDRFHRFISLSSPAVKRHTNPGNRCTLSFTLWHSYVISGATLWYSQAAGLFALVFFFAHKLCDLRVLIRGHAGMCVCLHPTPPSSTAVCMYAGCTYSIPICVHLITVIQENAEVVKSKSAARKYQPSQYPRGTGYWSV